MSVAEAQARISAREFAEWIAYYGMSPFGPQRDDIRSGVLGASLASMWAKKGSRLKASDFMPDFEKSKPENRQESQEQIWAKLRIFQKAHNDNLRR
jgi:hypothetical protein